MTKSTAIEVLFLIDMTRIVYTIFYTFSGVDTGPPVLKPVICPTPLDKDVLPFHQKLMFIIPVNSKKYDSDKKKLYQIVSYLKFPAQKSIFG